MAFAATTFAQGQLPSTAGTLWTVPAATADYVKSLILSNVSGSTVTFTLWKRTSSNDRQILVGSLDAGETIVVSDLLLTAGDSLKGSASAATSIDYVAQGVREA